MSLGVADAAFVARLEAALGPEVVRPPEPRYLEEPRGRYRGQALDRLLAQLESDHIPVSLVARIPETLWENRENIHFRRFPGNRYVYPWYGNLPDTLIYRVGS